MTPRRQYGDSELVEAARYAAPGEMGCFFPLARCGSGDRLPTADAPFTISKRVNPFSPPLIWECLLIVNLSKRSKTFRNTKDTQNSPWA